MVDATVVWSEPGSADARLIVIERGEIATRAFVEPGTPPPVPPGSRRPVGERHEAFTVSSFDRLRVLTTELKRVMAEAGSVTVLLPGGARIETEALRRLLAYT